MGCIDCICPLFFRVRASRLSSIPSASLEHTGEWQDFKLPRSDILGLPPTYTRRLVIEEQHLTDHFYQLICLGCNFLVMV